MREGRKMEQEEESEVTDGEERERVEEKERGCGMRDSERRGRGGRRGRRGRR